MQELPSNKELKISARLLLLLQQSKNSMMKRLKQMPSLSKLKYCNRKFKKQELEMKLPVNKLPPCPDKYPI